LTKNQVDLTLLIEKENRIREEGGDHIRDRETGCILKVECETREDRRD
jgi:hypothetical protein